MHSRVGDMIADSSAAAVKRVEDMGRIVKAAVVQVRTGAENRG